MLEFDTLQWLPTHLAKMQEWKEICKAYDYLLSKAMAAADEIYANQFIESLTELGCVIWEKLLNINVTEGETLEDRVQAIKGYLASDLPYTENKLRESLNIAAGIDNATLKVDRQNYGINIELTINTPGIVKSVQEIVYRMRPCNMTVRVGITYKQTNRIYVGWAVKHTKKLYPTDIDAEDPVKDMTVYVNGTALLVDADGSALIKGDING